MAFVAVGTVAFVVGSRTQPLTATAPIAPRQATAAVAPAPATANALAGSSAAPTADVLAPVADTLAPIAAPPALALAAGAPALVVQPARAVARQTPGTSATVLDAPSQATAPALADPAPADGPSDAEEAAPAAPVVAAPDPSLPDVPAREHVVAAIDGVRPAIQACAATRHGPAPVSITVGSNGRVRSAIVAGGFAGTPEGSCIARAIRAARFPAFAQPSFEVSYPFAL